MRGPIPAVDPRKEHRPALRDVAALDFNQKQLVSFAKEQAQMKDSGAILARVRQLEEPTLKRGIPMNVVVINFEP